VERFSPHGIVFLTSSFPLFFALLLNKVGSFFFPSIWIAGKLLGFGPSQLPIRPPSYPFFFIMDLTVFPPSFRIMFSFRPPVVLSSVAQNPYFPLSTRNPPFSATPKSYRVYIQFSPKGREKLSQLASFLSRKNFFMWFFPPLPDPSCGPALRNPPHRFISYGRGFFRFLQVPSLYSFFLPLPQLFLSSSRRSFSTVFKP